MYDRSDLHSMVVDSLEEQIAVIDKSGKIVDVNAAWERFGLENDLASEYNSIGSNYLEVLANAAAKGDEAASEAAKGISDVLNGQQDAFRYEYPCHSPRVKRWFIMRIAALKDSVDKLFVISHQNITERKIAERKAEYLARHDPLTQLANRRYFNEFLNAEFRRNIRHHSPISLMMVDVDHFKEYNDRHGHPAGDECLVKISLVLVEFSQRPGDLAARLGGDEFALLLGETGFEEAANIAEAIKYSVNDLDLMIDKDRQITSSIGVVSMVPGKDQLEDFLLAESDKALYQAKAAGRNCIVHEQPVVK
ncbi:MAG: sensor domain-containing diguanylate cyclase [Gammaproteobacteria bacterium]|nr:sensor domain-containing diguanylate cyclase [Gammaproteobacteria bacterium]